MSFYDFFLQEAQNQTPVLGSRTAVPRQPPCGQAFAAMNSAREFDAFIFFCLLRAILRVLSWKTQTEFIYYMAK